MPKVKRITTVIIGEGPTEYFYLNSLKDEFRELQNIKPDFPKNTSLRELERSIEEAVSMSPWGPACPGRRGRHSSP